jgi:sigma-B regulation protein RsbU (phosphoserine phosphatase)
MKLLLIEDHADIAANITEFFEGRGDAVEHVADGAAGLQKALSDPYDAIVLDLLLPGLDGLSLCRQLRHAGRTQVPVLMLTAKDLLADKIEGFEAGADDYLVKPFDAEELRARVHTGLRIVSLQDRLAEQVAVLQEAIANVKQLKGLLPMCSYCKSIRNDGDYWQQLETYISDHSEAEFSHGICPNCFERAKREFDDEDK